MATCIHSSRSPFYTIPIFPLLNRKIFHLLVILSTTVLSDYKCKNLKECSGGSRLGSDEPPFAGYQLDGT